MMNHKLFKNQLTNYQIYEMSMLLQSLKNDLSRDPLDAVDEEF